MDVCDGRHIVFVTNNRLGPLSGVAKPRALDGCGIPGLEKRETLRQAQGRLWGTPRFCLCQHFEDALRCWPPAET
jgi:hypothetical protein